MIESERRSRLSQAVVLEHYRDQILPFPAQMLIGRMLRQASTEQSNPDFISMWAGQEIALAEVFPAGELIEKLVQDCQEIAAAIQATVRMQHSIDSLQPT